MPNEGNDLDAQSLELRLRKATTGFIVFGVVLLGSLEFLFSGQIFLTAVVLGAIAWWLQRCQCAALEQAYRNAVRLEAANEKLRQEQTRLRRTIQAAPVAMIMVDQQGRIALSNDATERLFGYSQEEMNGQPVQMLMPNRFREQHPEKVKGFFRDPSARRMAAGRKLLALRKDGHEVPVEVGLAPIETATGTMVLGALVDVTEAVETNAALQESESRFRITADSSPISMWICDIETKCVWLNRQWLQYCGAKLEDHVDEGWLTAVHPNDRHLCSEIYLRAFENKEPFDLEYRLRRHDGQYRWHRAFGQPRFSDAGAFLGYVGVSIDEHDERRLRDELLRSNNSLVASEQKAQSAVRAKADFLANMSHEIRTPMNAIIGLTEIVLQSNLSDLQRDYLSTVFDSAESLLQVINDILDFSKIEAGKLELQHVDFAIRDTVSDVLRAFALKTQTKALELTCRCDNDVPNYVIGDPGRLRQILVNLIGNAVKFTTQGHVLVNVSVVAGSPVTTDLITLEFCVEDSGVGIPEDKIQAIFDKFEQVDGSSTRKHGGTGLGLAITSKLVEAMNGELGVESVFGKGSAFQFTAQFGRCEKTPTQSWREVVSKLKSTKILVVDDSPVNLTILTEMLATYTDQIDAAESGFEALSVISMAQAKNDPYRLIISDVVMEGMDGYQLAKTIQYEVKAPPPVILLTSSFDSGDLRPFDDQSVAGRLMKPVNQSELLELIIRALGLAEPSKENEVEAVSDESNTSPRNLRVLLAEDSFPNQKLALAVLDAAGHQTMVAHNGREAVEAVERHVFDVILMDIQMPELDGFQATAKIRSYESKLGNRTPIIAMTAHALAGDKEKCLNAGMDDYVSKPVRPNELFAAMNRVVEVEQPEMLLEETSGHQTLTYHPPNHDIKIPWNQLLRHVAGNEDTLLEIVQAYLDEMVDVVPRIDRAIIEADATTVCKQAHKLKNVMRYFRRTDETEWAQAIESRGAEGKLEDIGDNWQRLQQAATDLRVVLDDYLALPHEAFDRNEKTNHVNNSP
ncbi:hybrid sensor histidine kinase/response regulator [Roseiconus lacunae]|uniref:hybrid sensor histidine kinase/response regulator n=1 Tax=Roseiconus lacunae TaxID=2605694 RepID=UPI001E36E4E4|nr:response regulator [Roseiconus lacunae]MCD0459003.1 response regulator [Roseiconus lacunae]